MKATRLREAARRVLEYGEYGLFSVVPLTDRQWCALSFVMGMEERPLNAELRCMVLLMAAAVAESDEELP